MNQTTTPKARPLRYIIRQALLDLIGREGYQPGDQLPPEERLQEILNVSRLSLREALQLLDEERIIFTKHGSGRYLLSLPSSLDIDISNLQSVTELLETYHISAENRLLKVERHPAAGEIGEMLGLEAGEEVLSIERLRYAGGTPIIYSIDSLALRWLRPGWEESDFSGSLFKYLEEQCGVPLSHSQASLFSSRIENAGLPFDTQGMTWILLKQVIHNQAGEPVIFSRDYHRGDKIQFHVRRVRR